MSDKLEIIERRNDCYVFVTHIKSRDSFFDLIRVAFVLLFRGYARISTLIDSKNGMDSLRCAYDKQVEINGDEKS